MDVAACAVGRIGADGPWIGFAPALDDTYALVIGGPAGSRREPADADDLVSLALVYFEDALEAPPEDLAATHADIGALVRHLAEVETDAGRRVRLQEAVDGIDDGLASDVVVARLVACLGGEEEAVTRLARRAVAPGDPH
jgi:hypothetical protein